MSRYASTVEKLVHRLDLETPGVGVLQVPPGQQAWVAQALEAHWPGAVSAPLKPEWLQEGPARWIVTGLPAEREQARAALLELNDRRGWMSSRGRQLVLLLNRHELAEMQQLAGDVYSVRLFVAEVPFVPDPAVDLEEARTALGRWQRERFGRLDMRGFVRSESEDVAWGMEALYQDVKATLGVKGIEALPGMNEAPLVSWLTREWGGEGRARPPLVVLGPPGSGKTFFLRWLALVAAEREEVCAVERPVPLLASLAAYARAPGPVSLDTYLVEHLLLYGQPAAHGVEQAIRQRRALFLLDGLDEVGDEAARQRMVASIQQLAERAPGCLIIVTSRIAGYSANALFPFTFTLAPLSDEAIQGFLRRWCELYSVERLGNTEAARREGASEGERLAGDVLQHAQVRELARNPLLLTVLALVHRTGVRLPDHRVELYEHATRVLVERWSQARSLAREEVAPPIKAADAVRLLGPVALEVIQSGNRGAIPEPVLREKLQRSLASGNLRAIGSVDSALELFRSTLGLLVEQGPGLYSFLHLTLAEYFAAWEMVRTNELEQLARNPSKAFSPEWREVLLLASGVLGLLRADDQRLDALVEHLLRDIDYSIVKDSYDPPSLLGRLLTEDPGLSDKAADRIIHHITPLWLLTVDPSKPTPSLAAFAKAILSLNGSLRRGRFADRIGTLLTQRYEANIHNLNIHQGQDGLGALVSTMAFTLFLWSIENSSLIMTFLNQNPKSFVITLAKTESLADNYLILSFPIGHRLWSLIRSGDFEIYFSAAIDYSGGHRGEFPMQLKDIYLKEELDATFAVAALKLLIPESKVKFKIDFVIMRKQIEATESKI